MLEMYCYMVLARALDERMWLLNRQGKAPFVISCQGHEAAQVGAAFALERGKDWFAAVLPRPGDGAGDGQDAHAR